MTFQWTSDPKKMNRQFQTIKSSIRADLVALDSSIGVQVTLYQPTEPNLAEWKAERLRVYGDAIIQTGDIFFWKVLDNSMDYFNMYIGRNTGTEDVLPYDGYTKILVYDYTDGV